jgi:hypothetical protein
LLGEEVIFVKKQAKRGTKAEEEMRTRLENSLPWSLSRWVKRIFGQKRK